VIRASIHQVLDTAWLEVEQWRVLDNKAQWTSVGRRMLGNIDGIGNVGEAVERLITGLDELLDFTKEAWYELPAYRI
jgi:hypothetical protein